MEAVGRQPLLMLNGISSYAEKLLNESFDADRLDRVSDPQRFLAENGSRFRAVATEAPLGFPAHLWDALPALEIVVVHGVGIDRIDLDEARRRNVVVMKSPDILSEDVADLAIGMWIGLSRRLAQGDSYVRDGRWRAGAPFAFSRKVTGQRVGMVGLGSIGKAIARRAEAFASQIAYTSRSQAPGVAYDYEPAIADLARRSDALFVAVPGGGQTASLIGPDVLAALGPSGMLINVSRGSVVDETALISSLQTRRIGGAALDVFLGEPDINPAFAELDNVLLQPHQGSATAETRQQMAETMMLQLRAHFARTAG